MVNKPKYSFNQIDQLISKMDCNNLNPIHMAMKFNIGLEVALMIIKHYRTKPKDDKIVCNLSNKELLERCISLGASYNDLIKFNIFSKKKLNKYFNDGKLIKIPIELREEGEQIMERDQIIKIMNEKDGVETQTSFKIKDFINGINTKRRVSKEDSLIISKILTDVLERRVSVEKLKEFLV